MTNPETNRDRAGMAGLAALGWLLSDDTRASRLLALTGLTPDDIRARVGEPALLAAILRFLEAHEPDLVACAEAIGTDAAALVAARRELEA